MLVNVGFFKIRTLKEKLSNYVENIKIEKKNRTKLYYKLKRDSNKQFI